jgi:predicted SnoaL-like aldol condensation-catalyzing enzyme
MAPKIAAMDVEAAARRWAETWQRAWPDHDVEAIASLYADEAAYRALVFREPDLGVSGVRRYLTENFGVEDDVECWFGEVVAAGDRAAVEWWATWVENGQRLTLAGATLLRFRDDGQIVDHRDYWNQVERREPPFQGW